MKLNSFKYVGVGVVLAGLILLAACQAPFLHGGKASSLKLQLDSAVPGWLSASPSDSNGSRLLTGDAKTVHLTIALPDKPASPLFDQDASVSVNAAGKPSVSITATNIPFGKALSVTASVSDAAGVVLLVATRTITFSSSPSANAERLTLVPTADYPGIFQLDGTVSELVVAAGSWRLIAITIGDAQANTACRLAWQTLPDPVTVLVYDGKGAEISSAPVSRGMGGTVFSPLAAGTVYGSVYNAGTADITLKTLALQGNIASVGISLGDPLSRAVVFSHSAKSISSGDTLLISNNSLAALSGWTWTIDGVPDTTQTGSSFTWDSTGKQLGSYQIGVMVTSDGVQYSGTMMVTVAAAAATSTYTVTYSNQGADSGKVPVDTTAYASGASVTVLANSGGLVRAGWSFLGWTQDSGNVGAVLSSGSQITIAGNVTLYPLWGSATLGVMRPVPAGSFQRDATAGNVSTVAAFTMSQCEISQLQYQLVTGTNPSYNKSSSLNPVEDLSLFDAMEFCNDLSTLEGLTPVYTLTNRSPALPTHPITNATVAINWTANGYRLPTEMEWLWAAMGASSGSGYSSGVYANGWQKEFAGDPNPTLAGDNPDPYAACRRASTVAVGSKLPNELGLYDMSGNVEEMCSDYYAAYPSGRLLNYAGGGVDSGLLRCTTAGGAFSQGSGTSYPTSVPGIGIIGGRSNVWIGGAGDGYGDPGFPSLGFRVVRGILPYISYVFDSLGSANGIFSLTLPSVASRVSIKVWGAGGGSNYSNLAGGGGGYSYSTYMASANQLLAVVVGAGGVYSGALIPGVPAAGGAAAATGARGGGGSLVASFSGGSYTLLACAGGGGGGSLWTGAGGGVSGGIGVAQSTVASGGIGGTSLTGGGMAGSNMSSTSATLAGLGGNGGNCSSAGGGGGGGYGGGASTATSSNYYGGNGGAGYCSGTGSFSTLGDVPAAANTSDPDFVTGTGLGSSGDHTIPGGNGRVVLTINF